MKLTLRILLLLGAVSFAACGSTILQFNQEFSGAYAPEGTAPWVTATLTTISPGTVELRMATANLIDAEYVSEWYFNLDPVLNATSLLISPVSGTAAQSISRGADSLKADGDGWYDILFTFAKSGAARFGAGEVSTYRITGIPGLDEFDFLCLSTPGGGNGTWISAAHVQGIGDGDQYSGWIGGTIGHAPEPSPALLFGAGLTLISSGVFVRSRRRRAAAVSR